MRVRSRPGCPAVGLCTAPKILQPGPEGQSGHSRLPVPPAPTAALGGSTAPPGGRLLLCVAHRPQHLMHNERRRAFPHPLSPHPRVVIFSLSGTYSTDAAIVCMDCEAGKSSAAAASICTDCPLFSLRAKKKVVKVWSVNETFSRSVTGGASAAAVYRTF